ncbi:MAG: hypothetical protein ACREJC_05760, partial [Tepidisphaeraceae bacterium]
VMEQMLQHCICDLATPQQLYALYRNTTDDRRTSQGTFVASLRHGATPLGQHRNGTAVISLWALRDVEHWKQAKPKDRMRKYLEERPGYRT